MATSMEHAAEAPLPTSLRAAVDELRANRAARRMLEVRELELAAHVADQVGWVEESGRALPGAERLVVLGGDGAPAVAEFCTLELAAALGMRDVEARSLVADALDLRHRLPGLWQLVLAGELDAWKARRLASITRPLDRDAAGVVGRQLARQAKGLSLVRLEALAQGLVLDHLPVEVAEERRCAARDARGVWIGQQEFGIADVAAVMDAPAGRDLEATVSQLSAVLAAGGVTGGEGARRAMALGILATPARALQLQQASLLDELPLLDDDDASCELAGQRGHVCGAIDERIDPEELLPRTHVVLHLTDTTALAGDGPVRPTSGLKPLLASWLSDLFGSHRVTVRPVIDANHQAPSDAHECPPTMREAVEVRNPVEVFPWSTRTSCGLDMDHTIPFATAGPPGQTRTGNLGPLSRKVHRAKTHGGWWLEQPMPGYFLWESPLGYRYLVTPSRTLDLGRPDVPQHPHAVAQPQAS